MNEILKSLTDVPIAIVALVLGIYAGRNRKKEYEYFFLLITAAAIIGTVAHATDLPLGIYRVVWVILYLLLFEIVFRFSSIFCLYIDNSREYPKKQFRILELILFVCASITVVIIDRYDIYFFVIFDVICLTFLIMRMVKAKKLKPKVKIILLLAAIALILQGLTDLIPYVVAVAHIVVAVVLIILYSLSDE